MVRNVAATPVHRLMIRGECGRSRCRRELLPNAETGSATLFVRTPSTQHRPDDYRREPSTRYIFFSFFFSFILSDPNSLRLVGRSTSLLKPLVAPLIPFYIHLSQKTVSVALPTLAIQVSETPRVSFPSFKSDSRLTNPSRPHS